MIKLLTAEQMRQFDEATFHQLGVPSRAVMESAGRAVADWLCRHFPDELARGVAIVTGPGNNGGDGFVAARALGCLGYSPVVCALKGPQELTGDARSCAEAWSNSGGAIIDATDENLLTGSLRGAGLIIDAIFGTGFSGEPRVPASRAIELINSLSQELALPIVAIDIPSGVDASTGQAASSSINAAYTLAIQYPKIGHATFPGAHFCGEVWLLDVGISAGEADAVTTELILREDVAKILLQQYRREADIHKGRRGHVLVVGGGAGHVGAVRLSAEASLRTGAGLATVALPGETAVRFSAEARELMVASISGTGTGDFGLSAADEILSAARGKQAVVVGPGLGTGEGSSRLLATLISKSELPCVIDADALNLLAAAPELFSLLHAGFILTPHPGEAARLLRRPTAEIQNNRLAAAKELSSLSKCWVILKGARTVITGPNGTAFINPTAVPALATAGSGDVLSGILGALLARGLDLQSTSIVGVFIHGVAGEQLEQQSGGPAGALASDIYGAVPLVINRLLADRSDNRCFQRKILSAV